MPLNPTEKKKHEEAEKRLHRLEREQPEKVKKVRENLKAIGYSDEEVMQIVPKLPQKTIDKFNEFEPRFMRELDRGDLGADKLLEGSKEEG